jgi:hypothetical protein
MNRGASKQMHRSPLQRSLVRRPKLSLQRQKVGTYQLFGRSVLQIKVTSQHLTYKLYALLVQLVDSLPKTSVQLQHE